MSATLVYWPGYDESIHAQKLTRIALLALPPRQERIVRLHFGLGCVARSLTEIAAELNRSVERIRALLANSLRKLAHRVRWMLALPRSKHAKLPWSPKGKNTGNFGVVSGPLPQPATVRRYDGTFSRLVPVIMEMANAGYAPRAIHQRLTDDFNAATWMGPDRIRMIRAYVPSDCMIGYIIKTERAFE